MFFFFGVCQLFDLEIPEFPLFFFRTLAFTLSRGDSGVDGGDSGVFVLVLRLDLSLVHFLMLYLGDFVLFFWGGGEVKQYDNT